MARIAFHTLISFDGHSQVGTITKYLHSWWKLYKKTGMNELTARQQEILAFLKAWIAENGMPPTRAEMCASLGFRSPNAAEEHLRALERKGEIGRAHV